MFFLLGQNMSDGGGTTMAEDGNDEASFVIFAEGSDGVMSQIDQGSENQQLSIGDDGITIVVTPENEQQVSELLRALQASQNEEVQILTDSGGEAQYSKVKEDVSTDDTSVVEPPKKKRGRPPKNAAAVAAAAAAETANKKAKLIELALQEADASISDGSPNLKSTRLRERAAKQGGIKKLWLSFSKDDGEEEGAEEEVETGNESVNIEVGEWKSDGEADANKCEECPEVFLLVNMYIN